MVKKFFKDRVDANNVKSSSEMLKFLQIESMNTTLSLSADAKISLRKQGWALL